jgi:hypothetical protein
MDAYCLERAMKGSSLLKGRHWTECWRSTRTGRRFRPYLFEGERLAIASRIRHVVANVGSWARRQLRRRNRGLLRRLSPRAPQA